MLVMVAQVTQAANDQEPVAPMIERWQALPEGLSQPEECVADNGDFSERNVEVCEIAGIVPLLAMTREEHHPHWSARFNAPGEVSPAATPVARMTHRLKTCAGRTADALRKQTVEPVFGVIKSVMGFRQFLTRGLKNVQGEWTLVCLSWNLKRMAVLRPSSGRHREKQRLSPK